jgi:Transposase
MAPKVNPELCETWRKRIERQRQSGVTVGEFCGREGVSQASFYLWKRKLRGSEPGSRKRRSARRIAASPKRQYRKARVAAGPAAFVQIPCPSTPGSPWIEVALAEGTIIRIPQQNLAAVQTILRTLAGAGTSGREELRYA